MAGQINQSICAVIVCLSVQAGCTSATGGAVELSWKLRAASGSSTNFVDCDSNGTLLSSDGSPIEGISGKLVDVRLHWESDNAPSFADFECAANHGVTTFELPPGVAFLWVSPICDNGGVYDAEDCARETFSSPAPLQRTVAAGNTISLGAVELVLEVSECTEQKCICELDKTACFTMAGRQ
jgi:hypothetical protein